MPLEDVFASSVVTIAAIEGSAMARSRRRVMIGDAEGEPRLRYRASALLHLTESEERTFVHIVAVDPEQRDAALTPGSCADQSLSMRVWGSLMPGKLILGWRTCRGDTGYCTLKNTK